RQSSRDVVCRAHPRRADPARPGGMGIADPAATLRGRRHESKGALRMIAWGQTPRIASETTASRPAPERRRVGLVAHTPFWMFDHGEELTQRGWAVPLGTATPAWMIDPGVAQDIHVKLGWATLGQALRRLGRLGIDLPESWFMWMGRRARSEFVSWAAR